MTNKFYLILAGFTFGVLTQTNLGFTSNINLQDSLDDIPPSPPCSPATRHKNEPVSSNKLKRSLKAAQENNPASQQKFVPIPMKSGRSILIEPPQKKRGVIGLDSNVPINAAEVSRLAGEKKEAFLTRFNSKVDNPTRVLIPQRIPVNVPAHLINDIRFDPADAADVQAKKLTRLALLMSNTEEPIAGLSDKEKRYCVAECYEQAAVKLMEIPSIPDMDSAVKMDLLTSRGQLYLWAARNMPLEKLKIDYFNQSVAQLKEAQAQLAAVDEETRTVYEPTIKRDMDNALRGLQEIRVILLKVIQKGMAGSNS
jgi:hypothetical protein